MRGLVCWLMCLSVGCAEIADLRDDPTLIEGAGATSNQDGGGGAPQGCVAANLGKPGLCTDADEKCTVVELASGTVGCGPRGTGAPYSGCESDDDCTDGTFCDRDWTTCKPFCTDDVECGGGKCLDATDGGKTLHLLSGEPFRLCAANCNPVAATKCGEGAACFPRDASPVPIWDCGGSAGLARGEMCEEQAGRPCANGLTCSGGICKQFCFVNDPVGSGCENVDCVGADWVFDQMNVGVCD